MPLGISTDKVCFVALKAREFDVKVPVVEPDPGSNPTDDGAREVLEDYADDPTQAELQAFLAGLNADESAALVALMWIGRGDFDAESANEALAQARGPQEQTTAAYLLGTPLLGDYLEAGLDALGESCVDFEADRR